ncbi:MULTISPECIES: hypothetical protein [unclassified Streptomyces]|uniref:hypothetical protein n=1 Tax=unclassified Streptomyces TaxID=2593676 RepID=UPI002DDB9AFD|nr:hypothetical protein [Streptomyces sp. NBC_01257]WRZ67329.1 hypothetical protein OG408_27130 [Streptomyces sp. NBC_01257]
MTETNGTTDRPGSISREVPAGRGATLPNSPADRTRGSRTAGFRDPGGHVREIAR